MRRDATARSRIKEFLQTHGPVEDASGHATRVLRQAVAYQGSPVAFIQMLAAMDRDREIERTIKGKRTYRVQGVADSTRTPVRTPGSQPGAGLPANEIDYERLAKAIVDELAGRLATPSRSGIPASVLGPPAPNSLDSDEWARVVKERDNYAARLEEARSQLDELLGDEESSEFQRVPGPPVFRRPADSNS